MSRAVVSLFAEPLLHGFSFEYLAKRFDYNPDTGTVTRAAGSWGAGTVVGTTDGKGYLHVCINYKFVRLHQLAMFLFFGWCPKYIDHKNNDRRDNRVENLRATTTQLNAGNIRPPRHNTSGFKGASRNAKSGKWAAQIKINGKQTYLGRFDTKEEAALQYAKAAVLHFGDHAKGAYV